MKKIIFLLCILFSFILISCIKEHENNFSPKTDNFSMSFDSAGNYIDGDSLYVCSHVYNSFQNNHHNRHMNRTSHYYSKMSFSNGELCIDFTDSKGMKKTNRFKVHKTATDSCTHS